MATTSIYNLSEFAYGFRFDPEFYQPEFIENRKKVSGGRRLGELLEDIRYGVQAEPVYLEKGVNYIRALNLGYPWIEGEILKIDAQQVPSEDYLLENGDILITRSGANCGDVGIITDDFRQSAFGSYTIRLRFKKGIDPYTILGFLVSDIGRLQTLQIRYGSAQPNLSIPYLKNLIVVPKIKEQVSKKLEQLIVDAVKLAHSEQLIYKEAEKELLARIGWYELVKTPSELFYIENIEAMIKHRRIDAEHFQPKYQRLCQRLKEQGAMTIGDFSQEPHRGVQPYFCENGQVFVIDSKAVRPQGVEPDKTEKTSLKFFNDAIAEKGRIAHGDVLLNSTGLGTLGRASFYDSDMLGLVDNHVTILKPNPQVCLPVYLSLFLNSPIGLAQSEMFQAGSSGQLEIYPQHIKQILVYLPRNNADNIDIDWQERLASKVLAAGRAKQDAQIKIEEVKRLIGEAVKNE